MALVRTAQVSSSSGRRFSTTKEGFTIMETMIVLVIAAVIILAIFVAVPALQRRMRNNQRDRDAALLASAIRECMLNNYNNGFACDTPAEIGFNTSELSIFTGFHYGSSGGYNVAQEEIADPVPPTSDEPNYLFGLKCNPQLNWFLEDRFPKVFVVTYFREGGATSTNPDIPSGYHSRCMQG